MDKVNLEKKEGFAILRLNNGVTNGIDQRMATDLLEAIFIIKKESLGVLLTGGQKFFSNGLDLPSLLKLNPAQMREFWTAFNQIALELLILPAPVVCAFSGHAPAGGTILALACDLRLGLAGRKLMGLSEVALGLPVPYLTGLMLARIIGESKAAKMCLEAQLFSQEDGFKMGLVDEICQPEEIEEKALAKIAQLAALPRPAFAQVKKERAAAISELYSQQGQTRDQVFVDLWFSDATQALLLKAAEKF